MFSQASFSANVNDDYEYVVANENIRRLEFLGTSGIMYEIGPIGFLLILSERCVKGTKY
jgi:hypothetical protein